MLIRKRKSSSLKKTVLSVLALLILFVGGGIVYVYWSDQGVTKPLDHVIAAGNEPQGVPKPTQPAPNAREGAAVESLTSPVTAGSNASLIVLTNAGSSCNITVTYNGKPSTDSGLKTALADAYDNVTWTWTVGESVPVGLWPIKVLCNYNGRSAMVEASLKVVN